MTSIVASRRAMLLGAAAAAAIPAARAQVPLRKRRNIEVISSSELQAYEHAIQIVKDRSKANADDPTGYDYWAGLHDNFDEENHSGCAHYSEKFFPWHRQYLADFEALLQKTDPPVTANVMIPYWDWSQPPKTGKHFPLPFEQTASPLFDKRLTKTPPPWNPKELHEMIQETDWNLFAGKPDPSGGFGSQPGSAESGPHNTLHGNISRNMASPSTAVKDPIFWSFHGGIDLLWSRWQRLHVSSSRPQPFADPGALIWFRERSYRVDSTAKTSNYGYEYEYDFSPDGPPAAPLLLAAAEAAPSVMTAPTSTVALAAVASTRNTMSLQAPATTAPTSNTLLHFAGVRVFRDRSYTLTISLRPEHASAGDSQAASVIRTVTLWRHHDGEVELFIRPNPAQVAQLRQGWIVTVESTLGPVEAPQRSAGNHAAMMMGGLAPTAASTTSALFKSLDLQER